VAPRITFQEHSFEGGPGTLLELLEAQGHAVPSSCRAGACQTCLMQLVRGVVPDAAQQGLSAPMKERGLILACQCRPEADIEVALADEAGATHKAEVVAISKAGDSVRILHLRPRESYNWHAGQFLRLYDDGEGGWRNYSIASVPGIDDTLELHVGHVARGRFSDWIFSGLRVGDTLAISRALGNCLYAPGQPGQNLLLIGTGTGLAPLLGVAREALRAGHAGTIALYHGSRTPAGHYAQERMGRLARAHPNLHYHGCVSGSAPAMGEGLRAGRALTLALADHPDLAGWRVFLCGHPAMVEAARMEAFLAGAASAQIHADAFLPFCAPAG
jgi:ferredoxin-NADP reductase/ferredoxin